MNNILTILASICVSIYIYITLSLYYNIIVVLNDTIIKIMSDYTRRKARSKSSEQKSKN